MEYSSDNFANSNDSVAIENLKLSESVSIRNLVSISKHLVETGLLPINLLLERLEPEFLQSIGVVASADLFNKKVIKINTAMFYRQQKFNLLREESEGFSRLIIFVSSQLNFNHESSAKLQIDYVYDRILEMIGFFDLDPLKVLDILIETFIFGISSWQNHLKLLNLFSFPSTSIVGILGFKLANVYADTKFSPEYLEQIMTIVGLLLANGFITIDQIWPHLSPSDENCLEEFAALQQKVKESSSKLGVVNLNANSSENAPNSLLSPDSLTEQYAQDTLNTKLIPSLGFNRNLKSHLILALLSIGSVDLPYKLLMKFPHLATLNHKISRKMCHVIEAILENETEVFNENFLMGKLIIKDGAADVLNVSNWLNLLPKGGLFHSPILFSKISSLGATSSLIQNHLIPALASSTHDSLILSQELWNNCISTLPYSERYSIYGGWADSFYTSSLFGPLIKSSSIAEARKVMRRLAKENVRQYGRLVAKVTHSNPVIVLPLILDQIQAYDNIIPAVVEAFRFLTPLSFDILIFCLLRSLASPERDRLKEDGTNLASWLQNLSQFSSAIFRKYPQILDPAPLLRYIYAQLLDDNCLDLLLLQELLTQMTGIEKPENLSEALLEVKAAGGPLLAEEVRNASLQSLGLPAPSRRCINRLKSALESEKLTVNLLVAIAQASDAAIYRMDYSHLKLVSTLTDTCHSSLLQYLEFLKTNEMTSKMLDIAKMVKVNKVELPVALFIHKTLAITENADYEELFQFYYKSTTAFYPFEFLKTFWSLGLSDISVPLQRYQSEIARLNSSNSSNLADLQQEMKEQVGKCAKTRDSLMKLKDSWFVSCQDRNQITGSILKMALLPRLLLGPMEAVFAAKFMFHLHGLGPQHLSTLSLLDSIFDSLPAQLIPSLTEAESHCFGRFIFEILLILQGWQQSKEKYEREAIAPHLPGFMKRWSHFIGGEEAETLGVTEEGELTAEDEKAESILTESIDNEPATELSDSIVTEKSESMATELSESIATEQSESLATEQSVTSELTVPIYLTVPASATPTSTTPSRPTTPLIIASSVNENSLNWEDFRHVLFKWHRKLFATVSSFLTSTDYCSIKNSVIFLSHQTNGVFPRLQEDSAELERIVNGIKANESREDLKVLATRYSAMLSQNKSKLVKEHQFHLCETKEIEKPSLKRSASEIENGSKSKRVKEDEKRKDKEERRDTRDSRDRGDRDRERESRRDVKDNRDSRDTRNLRDLREIRDTRDSRDTRESSLRDVRETTKDTRDNRDTRESRDTRERVTSKDSRDSRDNKDTRDNRDSRDARDTRDSRDSRSTRDARDSRDSRDRERERERDRETARESQRDNSRDTQRDSRVVQRSNSRQASPSINPSSQSSSQPRKYEDSGRSRRY